MRNLSLNTDLVSNLINILLSIKCCSVYLKALMVFRFSFLKPIIFMRLTFVLVFSLRP